jgi:hypothetical protein
VRSKEQQERTAQISKDVLSGHSRGLGNREIAQEFNLHHKTVHDHLIALGLTTNNPRGAPPERIDDEYALCSTCKKATRWEDFALVKSYADGRRLSKCRSCRKAYASSRLSDIAVFLKNKAGRAKVRSRRIGVPCDLTGKWLLSTYYDQGGLCFYTDVAMSYGEGRQSNNVSLDRISPKRGYTKDNVVLSSNRINTIKQDVTLEELALWMPLWYARVQKHYERKAA